LNVAIEATLRFIAEQAV